MTHQEKVEQLKDHIEGLEQELAWLRIALDNLESAKPKTPPKISKMTPVLAPAAPGRPGRMTGNVL